MVWSVPDGPLMSFLLVTFIRVAKEGLEVGFGSVLAYPDGRSRLGDVSYINSLGGEDVVWDSHLIRYCRLDQRPAVAEDELEVGLGEVFFDFDGAHGILVFLGLRSLLNPMKLV